MLGESAEDKKGAGIQMQGGYGTSGVTPSFLFSPEQDVEVLHSATHTAHLPLGHQELYGKPPFRRHR